MRFLNSLITIEFAFQFILEKHIKNIAVGNSPHAVLHGENLSPCFLRTYIFSTIFSEKEWLKVEEIRIMNWSNPNKSGNSEEMCFIYIMIKKLKKWNYGLSLWSSS